MTTSDLARTKHIVETLQLTDEIKDMVITDLVRINRSQAEELVCLRGITVG